MICYDFEQMKYVTNLSDDYSEDSLLFYCNLFFVDLFKLSRDILFNGTRYYSWRWNRSACPPIRDKTALEKWLSLVSDDWMEYQFGELYVCYNSNGNCFNLKETAKAYKPFRLLWEQYSRLYFSGVGHIRVIGISNGVLTSFVKLNWKTENNQDLYTIDTRIIIKNHEIVSALPGHLSTCLWPDKNRLANRDVFVAYAKRLGVSVDAIIAEYMYDHLREF